MKPIETKDTNCIYAKDQPEYLPLPVHRVGNPEGEIISCWELTWKERIILLFGGRVYISMWTFNKPLQPIRPYVLKG